MFKIRGFISALALVFSIALVASGARGAEFLTVEAAHDRAATGELVLVDIRSRPEWKETGVPEQARTISMHEEGFLEKLSSAVSQNKEAAIGLICATGKRSTWLANELKKFGYTNIYNVSEGMFGSNSGRGWLAKGLPIVRKN